MEENNHKYNPIQTVKRRFFAMRNGVVADVLRRAGSPYKVIFGLNIPQIVGIASEIGHSRDLAEALWANNTTRESVLAAPMSMPPLEFSIADAHRWISTIKDYEAADILCHKLLRHLPYVCALADELSDGDGMTKYTGIRLALNIVYTYPSEAYSIAKKVLADHPDLKIAGPAKQIISEVEELKLL